MARNTMAAAALALAALAARGAAAATLPADPYFAAPPGNAWIADKCDGLTPDRWPAFDVRTAADLDKINGWIKVNPILTLRIHPGAYPAIRVKAAQCVRVLGIASTTGKKPIVAGVNKTAAWRDVQRAGGIITENLEVSPAAAWAKGVEVGQVSDCLGVPNDQQFFILRDLDVHDCGHHAFVTAHAHHLYVEIGRSTFARASSHLAYIDHVGGANVYDSTFESPGWGHALRSIALKSWIRNVKVSNVNLDGSIAPLAANPTLAKGQVFIGMAPLEIYTCGESNVDNVDITFYPSDGTNGTQRRNSNFAAILRSREAFSSCDVGEVKDGQWTRLKWGDSDYNTEARWARVTPLRHVVRDMRIHCVGPIRDRCVGWEAKGNYPVMDDLQEETFKRWAANGWKAGSWTTWPQFVNATKRVSYWHAATKVSLPRHRKAFMRGTLTNKVPLPVPLPGWVQQSRLRLERVSVDAGQLLRDTNDGDTYCYGIPPVITTFNPDPLQEVGMCVEQTDGRSFRRAFVDVIN